jgi:hypothetical protein
MPDQDDAQIQAEGGKKVTITIAEKTSSTPPTTGDSKPNEFVIENQSQILTITIAE